MTYKINDEVIDYTDLAKATLARLAKCDNDEERVALLLRHFNMIICSALVDISVVVAHLDK